MKNQKILSFCNSGNDLLLLKEWILMTYEPFIGHWDIRDVHMYLYRHTGSMSLKLSKNIFKNGVFHCSLRSLIIKFEEQQLIICVDDIKSYVKIRKSPYGFYVGTIISNY